MMSQNGNLQSYNWETQYDDPQVQYPRPISDEVISVYEIYVKEETTDNDGRDDVSAALPMPNDHHMIQVTCKSDSNDLQQLQTSESVLKGECMDLDAAIDSDVINADGTVTKLLGKDNYKYKVIEQNVSNPEDNVVVYSHPIAEGSSTSSSSTRLIDKDDPRSRLHLVKYLKRDGKTLKIWECGICAKEFRHQYTLMRHLPTHTDERNFKCEVCGKAFRQLSTLSQHKAIHSDARPYVCEFCKKTFNRVSTLISHRKTHSVHKPHKCQICGKGFHQKGNLRNHVFTHTNERPYKCDLCGKGFNQMSNLVCHKVKAHAHAEKMQYVCGICGKEFPRRFSLRSHEEYKHGIKYRQPVGFQLNNNEQTEAKDKEVKIVQLTNGDRNLLSEVSEKNPLNVGDYVDSVVIDPIETKALEMALIQGQTPFALFKPSNNIPVLVKVSSVARGTKHLLTPATAEDLRMAGKMSLSPTVTTDADGSKAVQVKVPVVATIIQKVEPDGKFSFMIQSPKPDSEQESLIAPLDSHFTYSEHVRSETERTGDAVTSSATDECSELLELAAQGGIQFVRATEDGRYEVVTSNEARDLMAQNSHDVTILDGEEADAINVMNIHGNGEVIIGDSDNHIMVLNSDCAPKSISMDDIEILEDKDIKILDTKSLDDRFGDGMNFFSQSKMDELMLGPKSLGIDGVGVSEHVGEGMHQHDFASILGHRGDVPLSGPPQTSLSSLLTKSHAPMSILNEQLPYMKGPQGLVEDLRMLNGSPLDDHHADYETKMKLPSMFDDAEPDASLIPVSQSDVKLPPSQNAKMLGNENCTSPSKAFPALIEVKILGPKNHHQDMISSQYQEMKMLSEYEQFLQNSVSRLNGCSPGNLDTSVGNRTKVRILGKKLETGIITNTESGGSVVKVLDKKQKMKDISRGSFGSNETARITPPRLEKQTTDDSRADSFLPQVCSPCDSDFLMFEGRGENKENRFARNKDRRIGSDN